MKQLSEDNTDLSMQALYKQKELRDVRDKIRKRRMDVNGECGKGEGKGMLTLCSVYQRSADCHKRSCQSGEGQGK